MSFGILPGSEGGGVKAPSPGVAVCPGPGPPIPSEITALPCARQALTNCLNAPMT